MIRITMRLIIVLLALSQTNAQTYEFVTKWGALGTTDGKFNSPHSLKVDAQGNVLVVDRDNHRIQKFTPNGVYMSKFGSRGAGNGQFMFPYSIAIDKSGNIYVVDQDNARIQKFTSTGSFILKWGSSGSAEGQFNRPQGIAVDDSGYVYVADVFNYRIQKFTNTGIFIAQWGTQGGTNGQFNRPVAVAVDKSGHVYVSDSYNFRVQKFTTKGNFLASWRKAGDLFFGYTGELSLDNYGNILIADMGSNRFIKIDSVGNLLTSFGQKGTNNGEFDGLYGITLDTSSGIVYTTDFQNQRVQKFTPNGIVTSLQQSKQEHANPLIFPNPSHSKMFHIQGNNYMIRLTDGFGKVLIENRLNEEQLDMSGYGNGVYLLELTQNNHVSRHKLILN
jgi:tripartite motif-containing protein 71